ncbi:MAG: sigma-54-dependent Fis family transcriptional regulator [Bacteroidales bacterium]|nr:sigma-54-dependent Fis family transcriptional regulator [Bacteroidales bacterium]
MKIFVVEDDLIFAKSIKYYLSLDHDNDIEHFSNGKDALSNKYKNPDLIILDYNLPGMNGMEVMKGFHKYNNKTFVILMSAQNDIKIAVNLMKEGAFDYYVKDGDLKDRLWMSMEKIKKLTNYESKIDRLEAEVENKYSYSTLIKGNSKSIKNIYGLIGKATRTNINVSITGETGTGKELAAKAIHFNSERRKKPFVAVNVSAIPHDLIESELFGHERGAFTGADTRKIGRFEEANHGTLFLDEIGDMDLSMQSKILRVLQENELVRIGGNTTIRLDIRLIVATHKTLSDLVRTREFREDLYYRLLGLPIQMPPLRNRDGDVLLLAKYFIDDLSTKNNLPQKKMGLEAQEKLKAYHFPGNVRELKAVMELAVVLSNSDEITTSDINFSTLGSVEDIFAEELSMKEYHSKIIKYFLKKYDNKVRLVAEKLDVGKSSIYNMLNEEETKYRKM